MLTEEMVDKNSVMEETVVWQSTVVLLMDRSGTNSGNGGNGGLAIGPGSQANGANGQKGGFAIGAGSDANGGGVALNGGNTNDMSGGVALNGGDAHPGCNIALGATVFQPCLEGNTSNTRQNFFEGQVYTLCYKRQS